jgi:dolichyl-phosphate-mannose-protein mannosyltransferase
VTRRTWLAFAGVVGLYLALLIPSVGRPGIYWDEQVDLDVTKSYLAGGGDWFHGSGFDPSQTRLPMYSVALLFAACRCGGLLAARGASCVMGALTLLAVYLYCRRFLDARRGLLACVLLATSPFFLSFARIALTESDIFVTCSVAWFLYCAAMLLREKSAGWGLATAVVLGLAVSSKFSGVALVPAAILSMAGTGGGGKGEERTGSRRAAILPLAGTALLLAFLSEAWWLIWRKGSRLPHGIVPGLWGAGMLLWIAVAVFQIRRRRCRMGSLEGSLFVAGYAAATFLLLPPVHTTEPDILLGLAKGTILAAPLNVPFIGEALAFYGGCILFKSSPLVGAGILAALAASLVGWKSRPELRIPLAVFLLYLVFLLKMPIAQTFYPMPLLPILTILAADQLLRLSMRRPRPAAALACSAFVLLALDLARCYPDFNLNGYQYLGARRLAGRSTVGYRGIVQVTTDGIEQALEWTERRARPGETVVTYITAPHIVRAIWPYPPPFRILDGLLQPPEVMQQADYVVIGINARIADDWGPPPAPGEVYRTPYDAELLRRSFRQVYSARRAFGLEVAGVWERKGSGSGGDPERENPPFASDSRRFRPRAGT